VGAASAAFRAGQAWRASPPGLATIYRILTRNSLISPVRRKRRREDYIAWERPEPMELWQMDIVASVMMADGTEAKVITGVDDHSRFNVIAKVVRRATGRAVCQAFVSAMQRFRLPDEVLTDNGTLLRISGNDRQAGELQRPGEPGIEN
jgi:transposase InsO family protein